MVVPGGRDVVPVAPELFDGAERAQLEQLVAVRHVLALLALLPYRPGLVQFVGLLVSSRHCVSCIYCIDILLGGFVWSLRQRM